MEAHIVALADQAVVSGAALVVVGRSTSPTELERYSPHADLAAKIGMPPVMDFQLLTDMGRNEGAMVLNRKKALFASHDRGAKNWDLIASLVETCKLNGVHSQAYFIDVLAKLVNLWPASRLDELMA
jgi:hypothetical protein